MRILVRLLLVSVFLSAAALVVVLLIGPKDTQTWGTVTAALAVIAAVISAWPSLRVLEMQEDASRPNPIPYLDLTSRYSLMLLRIRNSGASVAYNVTLRWREPIKDEHGKVVDAIDHVPVLMPTDSVSVLVGRPNQLFKTYTQMRYEGTVEYEDVFGRKNQHKFVCSAEAHRHGLVHDDELPRTLYDLQQIPKALSEIKEEISALRTQED